GLPSIGDKLYLPGIGQGPLQLFDESLRIQPLISAIYHGSHTDSGGMPREPGKATWPGLVQCLLDHGFSDYACSSIVPATAEVDRGIARSLCPWRRASAERQHHEGEYQPALRPVCLRHVISLGYAMRVSLRNIILNTHCTEARRV